MIVNIVRGKWAMHILLVVGEQDGLHFNAIRRSIPGISAKVPREQLDYLLAAGVVQRMPTAAARHEVIYSYTERGKELRVVLDGLNELAHHWQGSANRGEDDAPASGDRQSTVGGENAADRHGLAHSRQSPTIPGVCQTRISD